MLLSCTVFLSGAAVMVIEICGTRALAPAFGAGLFVWAALLAVTLGALAVGYYGGGAWIDRAPMSRTLGRALVMAACALGAAVPLAPVMLQWGMQHDARLGALVTALVLFAPSLIALGMVSPIAVRLAITEVALTGHRVGRTYAISTAGSLLGTLAVAFVLIPNAETNAILLGDAALLLVLGAAWLRGAERLVVVLLLLAPVLSTDATSRELPPHLRVVGSLHSPYGLIEVIDDSERHVRFMRADHSIIGARFEDGTGAFAYTHALEALRFARPSGTTMLQIGLGTGTLPLAMERHGLEVDVVEIDPGVVKLARDFFDYSGDVEIEDARTFINRAQKKYDFIVHDTFTGGVTPAHLLSREVIERAQALLRPNGILVLNIPGFADGPNAEANHAVARTIRAVFPVVRVFLDSSPSASSPSLSNLMFFASHTPFDLQVPPGTDFESDKCERAQRYLARRELPLSAQPGPLVTDGRNPLTWMQIPIADAHYDAMNKLMPLQAWLPW